MSNTPVAENESDLRETMDTMSRHPLKTISTQDLEAALAKALAELVPTPEHEYKVTVTSVNFGEQQLTRGPAKLELTVWNSRPIGTLLGGDIFGKPKG
jgi:hypothetical protein